MQNLGIVLLGFLKIIYEFALPGMTIILMAAVVTMIKLDKCWLRKVFNKYIIEGEE